jgi:hypothetical protein
MTDKYIKVNSIIIDVLRRIEFSINAHNNPRALELLSEYLPVLESCPAISEESPSDPTPPLIDPASDQLSIINLREIQYMREEAEKVLRRYNGDNDLIPDAPVVTWADYQLLDLVTRMISMVETMAVRLAELQKTVAKKF